MEYRSQVPKAVDAWQGDLQAKNRPKIAAGVAHPAEHKDLFEEGWEKALSLEQNLAPALNGTTGLYSSNRFRYSRSLPLAAPAEGEDVSA